MAEVVSFFTGQPKKVDKFWQDYKKEKEVKAKKQGLPQKIGYKPGFLMTRNMSQKIDILGGEEFDMKSRKTGRKPYYFNDSCKITETPPETNKQIPHDDRLEDTNIQSSTKHLGFDISKGGDEEIVKPSYNPAYKTLDDFESLYLGWVDTYDFQETDKKKVDAKKKILRKVMKNLFRFIFGNKSIQNLQDIQSPAKMLESIRQVGLPSDMKLPCNNEQDPLFVWFKICLEYRLKILTCEKNIATPVFKGKNEEKMWPIPNQYVKDLESFHDNLSELILYLDSEGRDECMDYTDPERGMAPELSLEEKDYARILKVFEEFVKDKQKDTNELYTDDSVDHKKLQERLTDSSIALGEKDDASTLYKSIVSLITTGSSSVHREKVAELEKKVDTLEDDNDFYMFYVMYLQAMIDRREEMDAILEQMKQLGEKLADGPKKELWKKVFSTQLSDLDRVNMEVGALLREAVKKAEGKEPVRDTLLAFVTHYEEILENLAKPRKDGVSVDVLEQVKTLVNLLNVSQNEGVNNDTRMEDIFKNVKEKKPAILGYLEDW
jgi:hypothetical protein